MTDENKDPKPAPEGIPSPEEQQRLMLEQLKGAKAKLASMQQSTGGQLEDLARMGVELDGSALAVIRLNVFISFVFQRLGASSPEVREMLATLFETEYQEKIRETLSEVKSDVRKQMLAAGAGASKGDLKKMWQDMQKGNRSGPGGGPNIVPPGFGGGN